VAFWLYVNCVEYVIIASGATHKPLKPQNLKTNATAQKYHLFSLRLSVDFLRQCPIHY
jgi:hypothetical protein